MSNQANSLTFDIDIEELGAISATLQATEHQVMAAYNRALGRTAVTLQKLSRKLVQSEIDAKSVRAMQRRLLNYRVRNPKGMDELKLWFGLNDVAAHTLKGRMTKTDGGAKFSSSKLGTKVYERGFVSKVGAKRYLFERHGSKKGAYHAARIGLSDKLKVTIEDEIFDQLPQIFMRHFETDLKGRVKTGLSKNGHEYRGKR